MIRWEEVLGRRYVVCEGTSGYGGFEVSMLEGHQITGLINPEVHVFNGIREYYFDVTGRVSFDELMDRRTVGEGELRNLFTCLNQTLECMRDYLIEADIILLDSKFIYFSEECVWFVYDLSEHREFGRELVFLVSSILDKVDYDNREMVCRCYQIFDIVSCSTADLQKIIDVFEEPQVSVSMSESGRAVSNEALDGLVEGRCIEEDCCIESGQPEELVSEKEGWKHTDILAGGTICLGIVILVILLEVIWNIMSVYC